MSVLKISLVICIVVASACSHKNPIATEPSKVTDERIIDYALVDTEYDRYIVYDQGDIVVDDDGAEDVRTISANYEKASGYKVVVRTSDREADRYRGEKVISLLRHFGVEEHDIQTSEIRDELYHLHDIVHISLEVDDRKIGYAKGP